MLEFGFIDKITDGIVLYVPQNLDKEGLLEWYELSLKFPYSGRNWDSLYDLLCDLTWISERQIWLCHDDLPKISKEELRKYIRTLCDAIASWRGDQAHVLHAVFPEQFKDRLDTFCRP